MALRLCAVGACVPWTRGILLEEDDYPPSPPRLPEVIPVYQRVADQVGDLPVMLPPIVIQAISTLTVCAFLALIFGSVRLYLKKKQQDALGGLPAASDGTWLLVKYDWCENLGIAKDLMATGAIENWGLHHSCSTPAQI